LPACCEEWEVPEDVTIGGFNRPPTASGNPRYLSLPRPVTNPPGAFYLLPPHIPIMTNPAPISDSLPSVPLFNTAPLSSILILPNRQRRVFSPESLQDLQDSIETDGLLHPPVVREDPASGSLILVAGENRLKAITRIFSLGGSFVFNETEFSASSGMIPYSSLGVLTPLQAEAAEYAENARRQDLSWQEAADATARLHALRGMQKQEAHLSGDSLPSASGGSQTVADTAKEIFGRSDGSYHQKVSIDLALAKHLDNPLIAKAKSPQEALKILRADTQRKENIAAALAVGSSFSIGSHTLLNTNCLDWMASHIASNGLPFSVICTDPPYGMGADQFGDASGKLTGTEHHYKDDYPSWLALMSAWAPLSFSITAPQAHAYVFCDFDRFHELKSLMQSAGWYVFRTPFIVHKLNSGRVPLPESGPRRSYETILYAIKGNKPVTQIYPDVIPCNGDDNLGHGAQKPVALFQNLLQRSVRPGDRILDCFAGTGPLLPAAHGMKCYATLLEMDPGSYGIILKRAEDLRKLESQELFPQGGV
jgi:ParB-like chromosome segregation protein Spo0J/DNA modification methylase